MTTADRDFYHWLSERTNDLQSAPTLFIPEIVDAARRFYNRETYSVKITRNARTEFLPEGETFDYARDYKRLRGQAKAVFDLMKDGNWRTLPEIKQRIGKGTEAAISARLRDFRKWGLTVEREHIKNGLHIYRLLLPSYEETTL